MKKRKTVLLIALTLAVPLSFGFASSAMNPMKIIIAGGYDDDAPRVSGNGAGTKKGDGLKILRYEAKDRLSKTGSASPGDATSGMVGDSSDSGLGSEFFTDPDKKIPVTYRQLYETAGFIGEALDSFGEVIDGEVSTQVSFGAMDSVYIDRGLADNVKVGDKFLVFHAENETVEHPVTKKNMGRKVLVDAVIEVNKITDKNSEAVIIRSYGSVERGSKIIFYKKPTVPGVDPDKPISPKSIDGYVVASKLPKNGYAMGDVVYFDVGFKAGVEPGDVFAIIDSDEVLRRDGTAVKGLPKIKGRAKILSTLEDTCSALIFASRDVITPGDKITFSASRYQ